MRNQVLLCALLLFQFGIGNQPINDGFIGENSVYLRDWKMRSVNSEYYPLASMRILNSSEPTFMPDTVMHGETHRGINEITHDKVIWTTSGSAGYGFLLGYLTYLITDDILWAYGIGATVGTTSGATLAGNAIMEPNGSFLKSTKGAIIGTLVGGGIAAVAWLVSVPISLADGYNPPDWFFFVPALSFPVMGAVAGYFEGVPENSRVNIKVGRVDYYATRNSVSQNLRIEIGMTLINLQ